MATKTYFAETKERVGMAELLEHYRLTLTPAKDGGLRGACPFNGTCTDPRCFSVSTEKNIFRCFSCKVQGDVLDFIQGMEGFDTTRKASLWIDKEFPKSSQTPQKARRATKVTERKQTPSASQTPLKNEPVKPQWEMEYRERLLPHNALDWEKWKKETLNHFDCARCVHGTMSGRLLVPIHNAEGELLAFGGLSEDGEWRYPGNYVQDGDLYNLHRVSKNGNLIIVEDIRDVWKCYEEGIPNVVASVANMVSKAQCEALQRSFSCKTKVLLLVSTRYETVPAIDRLSRLFYLKFRVYDKPIWEIDPFML